MAPTASRSRRTAVATTTTAADKMKAGGSNAQKSSAAGNGRAAALKARKSLGMDPTLLQSSSDGEGEGEEVDHARGTTARTTRSTTPPPRATGKGKASSTRQSNKTQSSSSSTTFVSPGGTRRSKRLSGQGLSGGDDGLDGGTVLRPDNSPATHRNASTRSTRDASTKDSSSTGTRKTSNKRKAMMAEDNDSSASNMIKQLTPPDTDGIIETTDEQRQQQQDVEARAGVKRSNGTAAAKVQNKKQKSTTAAPGRTATRTNTRQPTPPPDDADADSDDDDFAFVRIDLQEGGGGGGSLSTTGGQPLSTLLSASTSASASGNVAGGEASSKRAKGAITTSNSRERQASARLGVGASRTSESKGKRKAADDVSDASANDTRTEGARAGLAGKRGGKGTARTTAAAQSKPKAKKGRVAELSREDRDEAGPSTPQGTSTVDVYTEETPAIKRNVAMRAGGGTLGVGLPPGTPGSARRASGGLRGRRGSSIGNGFEALPHPSLPPNALYRHIKADDPPAIRFRTLVAWSAHRLRESLEKSSQTGTASSSARVQEGANAALQALISDIVGKKIDLSWTPEDGSNDDIDLSTLPPNPANLSNAAKLEACQAWSERLRKEDERRSARIKEYKTMTNNVTRLTPAAIPEDDSGSSPNFSLEIPVLQNKEDVVAFGRRLLKPKAPKVRPRKSVTSRKTAGGDDDTKDDDEDEDPDVLDVTKELGLDLDEIRFQAAHLHQETHRLEQFLKVSDKFLSSNLAKSYLALTQLSGPATHTTTSTSSQTPGHTAQHGSTVPASTSAGLSSLGLPISASSSSSLRKIGALRDPRELLRTISKVDSSGANSASRRR